MGFPMRTPFLYARYAMYDKSRIAGMRLYASYVKLSALQQLFF